MAVGAGGKMVGDREADPIRIPGRVQTLCALGPYLVTKTPSNDLVVPG